MAKFTLVTDSTCDLPIDYYRAHNVELLYLSCIMDGVTYDGKTNILDEKKFYEQVRTGALPTTSQVNPEQAGQCFNEILKKDNNILYLAFSSGLSGTYQSGVIAANEIKEENPDANIVVIDTLCASLGEGLLLYYAIKLRDEDKTLEEVAEWVEAHKLNVAHAVTVDDLFHLQRGGRISKASAVIGSMINIKPMIHVNDEGRLINIGKMRGRKKALSNLLDMMEERLGSYKPLEKNEMIMISHSDCEDDARAVADMIKEKYGYNNFLINMIGPVIGSHTGAGTVALFFMADKR